MNVHKYITKRGTCEGYEPPTACQPTGAPAGSREKVEVLRRRLAAGQPLWHPEDETQLAKIEDQIRKLVRTKVNSKKPNKRKQRNAGIEQGS